MPTYRLYGLAVNSDFTCPELTEMHQPSASGGRMSSVDVRRSSERLELPNSQWLNGWMAVTPSSCLYEIADVARMLIEDSGAIHVEMMPGADESDMRTYLFGMGFATLLHMRGMIPLHLSAIHAPDGVIGYTGDSGAGKSTRVAELHIQHRWPIICDDVAVLDPSDEQPILHAGMNRIKLWRDAVERLGIDASRLTRDLTRQEKFHLCAPEMFVDQSLPLTRLVQIDSRDNLCGPVSGGDAFSILMNAVYRPELLARFGNRGTVVRHLARMSNVIAVERQLPIRG